MPADIYWDAVRSEWIVRMGDEREVAAIGDIARLRGVLGVGTATLQGLNIGTLAILRQLAVGGGSTLAYLAIATSTTPPVGIGSLGGLAIATLIGSITAAVGDKVSATPKSYLTLPFVGMRIPTTNTLVAQFVNVTGAEVTQAAVGWDVFIGR